MERTPGTPKQHPLHIFQSLHGELDGRVKELGKRRWLSHEEQREMTELKKRKLLLKDAIAALSATR